jgi:hypothetical protein
MTAIRAAEPLRERLAWAVGGLVVTFAAIALVVIL